MKFWMKYLIGVALGIVCAFVFRFNASSSMELITEIFVRIGRYCVVPLASATAAISVFKLIQSKLILKTAIWTGAVVAASSIILTLAGLAAIMLVRLPRIPITASRTAEADTIGFANMLRALFPYSSFDALTNGTFLFAPILFAFCAGIAFSRNEQVFRPVIQLTDSLSQLFYVMAKAALEIISIGMIAISFSWVLQFKSVLQSETFMPIFVMLAVLLAAVAFLIYPLAIFIVCHDTNPYRILYASIAPFLVALLSGDANLTLPVALCHTHESVGIRRRVNGTTVPLISIFARGGTGLVLAVCFIVIRRSYSDLSIPLTDVLWLFFSSLAFSFLLGAMPTGGTFAALSVLCEMYGRGFEAGFLLLRPMAFMLGSLAAAFDVLTLVFGSYIVSVKTQTVKRRKIARFI